MRDLNENSNSCSWPAYYGDKPLANGQYYNGFLPRAATDLYSAYDKDVLKRTMLEHEETFKKQVFNYFFWPMKIPSDSINCVCLSTLFRL